MNHGQREAAETDSTTSAHVGETRQELQPKGGRGVLPNGAHKVHVGHLQVHELDAVHFLRSQAKKQYKNNNNNQR